MPARLRPLRSHVVLALVLAAIVVALGGVSSYRKIRSFQPTGFEAHVAGGRWVVDSVETRSTGLQVGDQILLVNGQGYGQLDLLADGLLRKPQSELVVLRGEEIVDLAYQLPPLQVDVPYLILALIGVGYLLIGFYTLLRDPRRPAMLFYLWCLTSTVVYLVSTQPPYDTLDKAAYLFEELARIFLAPLTLHLFVIFPTPLRGGTLRRAVPFFYLPATFLLALQLDLTIFDGRHLLGGATAATLALLDRLELFHIVGFSLIAAVMLAWRLRASPGREPQRQATWIAVGMGAGYLPFLCLYVLPLSAGFQVPWALTSAAVLPLALVPVTFAYAILRYKLWDIGGILRNTISLSLTVLIGAFGFALANLAISQMPQNMAVGRNLLTFLSGLVIAGLLVPTRRGLSSSIERLQYRGSYAKRRALAEFGRELLKERDLNRLANALADRLETTLELRRTNLFLAHGQSLLPVRPELDLPDLVPFDSFPEDFWETDIESFSGVEFPDKTDGSVTQHLFAAGYRYAFPLRVRNASIGFVVTGYRDDDLPLSSDDLELIRNLLNQAALAIENAQLLHQVQLQLEEVLRLQAFNQGIIESSPAGIAVLGLDHRVRSANVAFAELVGRDRRTLAGKRLADLLPIEPLPQPDEGLREVSFTDSEGDYRYLQISVAPLRQQGSEEQRVLVVQDISARVEMERELKEKDRLASLGMLAAGVAHEVNTPITGISSYAQMLLADTPETDPRFDLLKKVEKQTFRAAQIVNNLLEFARNRRPEQGPVSLTTVIGETLDLMRERMHEGEVVLEWEPPADEIAVTGNQGELMQVFTNLVMNAVDAMSPGGTLSVSVVTDQDWVWATVQDTGPGISPRELEKIFQPFFSSKLGSGGTGLGLAITYNIVRRHGGTIRVISHPGEGSRFVVELPRRKDLQREAGA